MTQLAAGTSYVDLEFEGRRRVIATAVLDGGSGVALIDPGPSTTLPTLRRRLHDRGIGLEDVTALILTHIHLDHAGACGSLVAERPSLRVYVHERGAPHMSDPSKLVASAARLYGESNMDRLWGAIRSVPEPALVVLRGGERIEVGGRQLDVAYTPGHASHHVSYFDAGSGIAFVGDTAGIRLSDAGRVLPPTPPPDIDLEAWDRSLDLIEARQPQTLFVTHFGAYESPRAHLTELRQRLHAMAEIARVSLEREGSDEERERWFAEEVRRDLRWHSGAASPDDYEAAGRLDLSWRGLARYWRKKLQS